MCHRCNYSDLLIQSGLAVRSNRLKVLEIIGSNNCPLSAQEIYATLCRNNDINRVTVYRILDLLVEKGIVERLSGGGRSFYYGLAPNDHHRPHPHFYCKNCGQMQCLNPDSLLLDAKALHRTFPGRIESVEVRVDGVCKTCLRTVKSSLQ